MEMKKDRVSQVHELKAFLTTAVNFAHKKGEAYIKIEPNGDENTVWTLLEVQPKTFNGLLKTLLGWE